MIIPVSDKNETVWAQMCTSLWPHHTMDEFLAARKKGEYHNEFLYLYENKYAGSVSLSVRNDYVEGTSSSPVGYVEGIYVLPEYRGKGIAKELINFAKKWALKNGCCELASDCEIDNLDSLEFHKKLGFKEANRIICFVMHLKKKNAKNTNIKKIKKADINDAFALSKIHALSWKKAFKGIMPQDFLDDLKEDYWVEFFENGIKSKSIEVLIAYSGNNPVGEVTYGKARDENLPDWGEIISIYMLPEYFYKGFGTKLIK